MSISQKRAAVQQPTQTFKIVTGPTGLLFNIYHKCFLLGKGGWSMLQSIHMQKYNSMEHTSIIPREEQYIWRHRTPLLKQTCTQEVPSSNTGKNIKHHNQGCSWFSSAPPGKFQDTTFTYTTNHSFHILSNLLLTINQTSDTIQSEFLKHCQNKPQINK
jgi:hypothetical protein